LVPSAFAYGHAPTGLNPQYADNGEMSRIFLEGLILLSFGREKRLDRKSDP
jgi:hypothetical protein